MNIRTLAAAFCLLLATTSAYAAERPNILLLICDDCGYGDITPAVTPSLSDLAAESARFDNGYADALCSPTRAALNTGRYAARSRVYTALAWNAAGGLPLSEITLAEQLKAVGYHTGLIGKWHLGHVGSAGTPLQQGYDEHVGSRGGAVHPFTHRMKGTGNYNGPVDWWRNDDLLPDDRRYSVYAVTEESVGFIERNATRPWFLTVAYHAIHVPRLGPDGRVDYVGMLKAMDRGIGEILDKLRDTGQEQNTLVWFISDNGGYPNARNGGLKGVKGTLWEGGIKVQTYVRWPGQVPPGPRGGVVHVTDTMPTILDIIGERPAHQLDGQSLQNTLRTGSLPANKPHFWSTNVKSPNLAVRDGDWKLVRQSGQPFLFNLATDRNETLNRAGQQPARVRQLQAEINAWRAEVGR